jgi:arginine/lysine/ornithine decarboxylase
MNNAYYGLVTDAKNVSYVVENLSDIRHVAERQLREHCKANKLTYQDLRPTGNKQRGGNVLTKFAKKRKAANVNSGYIQ